MTASSISASVSNLDRACSHPASPPGQWPTNDWRTAPVAAPRSSRRSASPHVSAGRSPGAFHGAGASSISGPRPARAGSRIETVTLGRSGST